MTRAPRRGAAGAAAAMIAALALGGCQPAAHDDAHAQALLSARCTGCHDLGRLTRAGYDLAGWRNTLAMMVNVGAKLSPQEADELSSYLTRTHPPRPKPPAVEIAGPVQVAFQEWDVPTPGSRPHDPLATADGMIWYTGQMANVLGRVDPRTGQIKQYALPPKSGPHGLVADADGRIWYTANFAGYIGRLDPASGEVVQHPMPDPAARDPHTLIFDRKGVLWFTAQGANMVGRLDPASSEIRLVRVSTPKANPYGLALDSHGAPFFDEFGTNKIGRIDPATLKIREYVLPDPGARPRRIAITADDAVWYTDYARGFLGRLDPSSGKVVEYASPGGPQSRPYAITVLNGAIWYVESNTQPNALVRFDPKSHAFQTWKIPGGGGVVRNMMATASGGLALAESGVNKVALATIH